MNRVLKLLTATGATLLAIAPLPAVAAPTPAPPMTQRDAREIYIPFDPPIGRPLRYRYETTSESSSEMDSSFTMDLEFHETDEGYRLVVTPIAARMALLDPDDDASEQLRALAQRPYVLILDEYGDIVGMEDEQAYWDDIMAATEAVIRLRSDGAAAEAARRMLTVLRSMPAETRLMQLTESIQPLLGFAETEMVVGERVASPVSLPTILGGTVDSQFFMTLDEVTDGSARVSTHVSLSREQLAAVASQLMETIAGEEPGTAELALRDAANGMSREIRETYAISMSTGLASDYRSTDLIETGGTDRRATVRTLRRID